jgi:hypothetical protein
MNILKKFNKLTLLSSFIAQNSRTYTTSTLNPSVLSPFDPWFITGFLDGEACFSLEIRKNNQLKAGWRVEARFKICLHEKDRVLLEMIRGYFGGIGNIAKQENFFNYQVFTQKDIFIIIAHFDKYPLITQKRADYILFKQAFDLIYRKEHLTKEGLNKILAIKASLNKGLSSELKKAFPDITPVPRPTVNLPENIDPNWLSGFTAGDGCFFINIIKSSDYKFGAQVRLRFVVTQHSRDTEHMKSLVRVPTPSPP